MMQMIRLTEVNIADEHICCAISDKKCAEGYRLKKDWLKVQFKDGYRFQKMDVRGKVFIEYVPIAHSWLPLSGSNYMVINCFWVAGQYKGQGNGKRLLQQCINDAKAAGMDGVVAVTGEKKRPFMSDPKFLKKQGFEEVDQAAPFFRLLALRLTDAPVPKFLDSARSGRTPDDAGITAYYSNICPFTEFYTNHWLREYAKEKGVPVTIHHLTTQQQGRDMPVPWVINSVFYKGELVSLEMKAGRHLGKVIG